MSYWLDSTGDPPLAPSHLEDADVVVLGAGIAGITTAYLLKQAGLTVTLIEAADRLAAGVTGHTTAKVTSQHGAIYAHLTSSFGKETAQAYGSGQQLATDWIETEASAIGAEMDWSRRESYAFAERPSSADGLRREAEAAAAAGLPATFTTQTGLPFEVAGAVRFTGQAQFHPRRWLLELATRIPGDGGTVVTGTRALALSEGDPCVVETTAGPVRARHVVVTTHYPIFDRGLYFARLEPRRDLVVAGYPEAAGPDGIPAGMYISTEDRHSVRTTPGEDGRTLLIVGGEPHRVGARTSVAKHYDALRAWARERLGLAAPAYRWLAHDLTTVDSLPYVGRFHPRAGNVWVATGFGHWGMTNGTLAGLLLRDLVTGVENPLAGVFDPQRVTVRQSATEFVKANAYVAGRFLGDRVDALTGRRGVESLPPGSGRVVSDGVRAIAAYRDEEGGLSCLSARCTHLGCLVVFNDAEKTWDCPCHASRFATDGRVLAGPAVKPLPAVPPPS
ncbi:FAD-dependent oxidoreductase [Jiangella rhizosphaerae]|uniref:FAD-dependent oxidoreductase n=1 Tax=Jiangella rhizosphaerae TaxID=2293569 RepID=A0A418KLC4_9ACTN|nr:FAD-dependent oxidoreductase [Jiangella rhizosphaerae]RIQ18336.1 FAD-dependent oxidoreductase [Jiangella rhizosphaerae]